MELRVERCSGNYFRVTDKQGHWAHVANPHQYRWDRSHATKALDYFTYFHDYKRRNIRFYVV